MWSCERSMDSQDQSGRCSRVTCLSASPQSRDYFPLASFRSREYFPLASFRSRENFPLASFRSREDFPGPGLDSSLQDSEPEQLFSAGARVLARHQRDGLYHEGTVVHKVQSCRGLWVVEFCQRSRQLLCSEDMVHFEPSQSKGVRAGDAVLCPVGPGPGSGPGPGPHRLGPGTVVSVTQESSGPWVGVLLWNGRVSVRPLSSLCPLSLKRFHRISRELLRPGGACYHGDGLTCLHGDRLTCPSLTLQRGQSGCQSSTCYCSDHITCPSLSPPCVLCCVQNQTRSEPGLTRSEPGLRSSSGFISDLDRTRDEDEIEDYEESESREQRPPWRYWRRTGPEPNHMKPGGAVSRRTPHFSYVTFPSLQCRATTNHSAVFQTLANHRGGGGGTFKYRPRPPQNQANHRPRSVF